MACNHFATEASVQENIADDKIRINYKLMCYGGTLTKYIKVNLIITLSLGSIETDCVI